MSIIAVSVVATGALVAAGPASAQTVETGSLSFNSDVGDWVGGGQSYSYDTTAGDTMGTSGAADDGSINVNVDGVNGDWWYLTLAAPQGQALTPGTYTGATRAAFRQPGEPGIDLSGDGRGCNTITGSFTVDQAVFGPHGYVEKFDATYEQHCEGGTPALRGEVHISNPPPPPALDLGLSVATDGTASSLNGNATTHGTVTCTKAATVYVSGTIVETVKRVLIRGSYSTQVSCTPDGPVDWTATAVPTGTTPFQKGQAEVTTHVRGYDSDYGADATADDTTVVTLKKTSA